jgi:hypothetical protein
VFAVSQDHHTFIPSQQSNPELPSEGIHAVKHSLTYWQRAVTLLCPAKPSEQSFLPVFKWPLAKELRQALVAQFNSWQSLILCQQNLSSFTIEKVTQRLLSDFMKTFEEAVGRTLQTSEQTVIGKLRWWLIGGVIALLGIIVLIVLFLASQQQQLSTILPVFILILGSIVGFFGSIMNRVSNWLLPVFAPSTSTSPNMNATMPGTAPAGSDLTQHFAGLFGLAGTAVVDAFQAGYDRILIEFGDLNYAICVADPLVEFFVQQNFLLLTEKIETEISEIEGSNAEPEKPAAEGSNAEKAMMNFVRTEIRDSYDCLTKIFWTAVEREQEMQDVVRAAFGPIGAFVKVQLLNEPTKTAPAQKGRTSQG